MDDFSIKDVSSKIIGRHDEGGVFKDARSNITGRIEGGVLKNVNINKQIKS